MIDKKHKVEVTRVTEKYLYLIIDGKAYQFLWEECSEKLAAATHEERAYLDISPSGYGIHWPLIDEDLAIDPLIKEVGQPVPTS